MKLSLRTNAGINRAIFILAALLNIASWAWILVNFSSISFPAIVHYNVFFGRDLLGERIMLLASPILGTIVLAINFLLFRLLEKSNQVFLSFAVSATTLGLQALVLLTARIVILVNT